MAKSFRRVVTTRWGDCDIAGIVYYPKFFDMINALTEDWFSEELGTSYAELMRTRHVGFPTVRVNCDFLVPCQFGEDIELSLFVASLGRTSMALDFRGQVGGRSCLRAVHTLVMMSRDTYSAVPIPEELRTRIEPFLNTEPVTSAPIPAGSAGAPLLP
jgi:4-hydroxybenzoyl-CoA thioesterase